MSSQTLTIGTRLDRRGSKSLRKALNSALGTNSRALCFDASFLEHADAVGLAELFAMISEILEKGREVFISGASASMLAMFELVQLDYVAEIRGLEQRTAPINLESRQAVVSPMFGGELTRQMAS